MFTFNRRFRVPDALWVPLRIAPVWGGLYLLFTVATALVPSLQILAIADFIRSVQTAVMERSGMIPLVLPALSMFALMALQMLLTPLRGFVDLRLQMRLRRTMRVAYLEKLNRLEYRHIESPEVWDIIDRLTLDFVKKFIYMEEKFSEMFGQMVRLIQVIVGVVSVVVVLTMQVWWLGLVMVVIAVPVLFLSYRFGGRDYDMGQSYLKYCRASNNLGEVLLYRQYTFERFLFHFTPQVNKKWEKNYALIRRELNRIVTKSTAIVKLGGILNTLMAIVLILIMAFLVAQGAFTVAVFIPLVSALFALSQTLSWEMSDCFYSVARMQRFFVDLTQFALLSELESKPTRDIDPGEFRTLEFREVRFRYPDTEIYVLDGVNLLLERGRHYAFVGVNGAGKTTITKLIMGLYDDYEGEILLNGIELRYIPLAKRKNLFTAVFQDFAKYEIPFEDNIRLGNPQATDAQIEQAVELVGLTEVAHGLPEGMRTTLGKLKEGGVEVSGGEWQRIAMARAVVNPAAVKILDEPTAALDPLSESRVYEQFGEISRDATTVYISHRLGSTQLADIIFVLENGRITESGTHEELMANRATYFAMYDSQRSWYV